MQAPRSWSKAENEKRLDYSETPEGSVSDGGVHDSVGDLSKLSLVDQSDEEAEEPLSEEEGKFGLPSDKRLTDFAESFKRTLSACLSHSSGSKLHILHLPLHILTMELY